MTQKVPPNSQSGPHHGHYVTIIRTPATWLIFDDETVEPIKESEISKYFGESNSGSAYVLYYQAVDLDLAALGLRSASPPVAVADIKDVVLDQLSSLDPPASPTVPVPSLPPGLVDEPDSSDGSDPASITPPQTSHSPLIAFIPPKHSPPLTLNISSTEDNTTGVPTSPTATISSTTGPKAGLFQSLRHSPSIMRGNHMATSSNAVERRSSIRDMVRPSTSPGLPRPPEPTVGPPVPAVPAVSRTAPPSTVPDEPQTQKTPERKPSTWFKRRSGKSEKRPEAAIEALSDPSNDQPFEPTALYDVGISKKSFHSPKSSVDYSLISLNSSGDRKGSQESHPSSGSPSSFPSTAVPLADSAAPITPTSLPTIPASPQGPLIPVAHPPSSFSSLHRTPIDHRRSQAQLTVISPRSEQSPESLTLPPRPSTAGATSGAGPSKTPPPLPPLPTFTLTHRRGGSNDQQSDATASSEQGSTSVAGDLTPIDSTAFSIASSMSAPLKRASRKLSLSSPILGFGRKEKKEKAPAYQKVSRRNTKELEKADKGRGKEEKALAKARRKEEDRKGEEEELALSPSAFQSFAMMGKA